jgi:nitroreductase
MQLREPTGPDNLSAVIDAISGRRSVRDYTAVPPTQDEVQAIIDAATLAPSALNEQPWLFTVVTNSKALAEISRQAKAHALREFGEGSHIDHARQLLSDPSYDILHRAPALVVISAPANAAFAVEDCALAAQNLMLAAYARGLGTCWIGFAQNWLNTEAGRKAINLPANHLAVAPIVVGHAKSRPGKTERRKPKVHRIA